MSHLELRNVSKGYGGTEVLSDINLSIEEGEFVALIGFSGSGKTTLISILAGLIAPDRGEVLMRGAPAGTAGPDRGVVFQSYSLMPWLTVFDNVARVLRLKKSTQLTKLVLPSALPYIFTGMRLSLGVGWMVLIAAEMLAQNPGLGKFVWDEFQNGSSESLSRIMVAVFTIGIIGFLLDRVMLALQSAFTYGPTR